MKENKGKCCNRCTSVMTDDICIYPQCECHCTIHPLVCSIHKHYIPQANSTVQGKVQDGVQAERWEKEAAIRKMLTQPFMDEHYRVYPILTYIEQEKQRAVEGFKERLVAKVKKLKLIEAAFNSEHLMWKQRINMKLDTVISYIREEK